MPRISVIVPIYRVEKYLLKCVDSVLTQTFADFELILVDDGSPDSCGGICDKYADQDKRVRVIHKENGGVSSARNAGLDSALGDYILFCDSDDWLSPTILEKGIRICGSGADICAFGSVRVKNGEETSYRRVSEEINCNTDELSGKQLTDLIENNYITAPWAKLISRSLIGDLRFSTELTFGEDMVFILSLLEKRCRLFASEETEYYYRENLNGLTSTATVSKCTSAVVAYRSLFAFVADKGNCGTELMDYTGKRWAADFKEMLHQIYLSDKDRAGKLGMIKLVTGDKALSRTALNNLSKAEKYECMALCFKSIFPELSGILNRFIKRPKVFD